jgi:hypothetical protein
MNLAQVLEWRDEGRFMKPMVIKVKRRYIYFGDHIYSTAVCAAAR